VTITKSQLRTRVLQAADAVDAARWDDTANGEVDVHIGTAMDREWKRILNANPYYRIGRRTPTSSASTGYYAVSDLDSGSGNSAERLYRVIAFSVDSTVYEETRLDQYLFPSTSSPQPQYLWYFEGSNIVALPLQYSKQATVVVNHIPTRQESLSAEDSTVTFPDGYENVLVFSAAALLLVKGGAEATASQVLEIQAEELRDEMLQDIQRRSIKPIGMRYSDNAGDWGSQ
jgi:hypothetical protein